MEKIELPEPLKSLFSVEHGALANFFGSAGTGKTNICLLLAVECASNGGKVAYIDTEGGFSVERVNQIINGSYQSKKTNNILNSIILLEPKNFQEQGEIIRTLEREKFDIIVLDSAVALYRLESSEKKNGNVNLKNADGKFSTKDYYKTELSDYNRELSKQLSILSSIARLKKIPVVVTAHTYKNWDTGDNELVGGESIKYWSKSIIFVEKTGKTGERKATIVKHRSQPEGKSVKFQIVEEGIKPAGFKIF